MPVKRQNLRHTSNAGHGTTIRILLADDHTIFRSGLRELIEKQPGFKVVAEAENGRSAVRQCSEFRPDIVFMDISMPDLNGIEATRKLLESCPGTKVIILSVHSSQNIVTKVLKTGASGYLLKDCCFDEIVSSISSVLAGDTYLSPKIAAVICKDYLRFLEQEEPTKYSTLTPREREVLQLLAEGLNSKEIAFNFNLSVKTVDVHRQRIMDKLNIHNLASLTKYAIREGLTSEEN